MLFRTGTSTCRQGFYLRGLARGDSSSVGSIDWGICCKSSHHRYRWRDCYDEDVSNTFNKAGLSECSEEGSFITGFHKQTSGGQLSSIKKFKCCKMEKGEFIGYPSLILRQRDIECFYMTSRQPYLCTLTMKQRPCWSTKPVLREQNTFLM